MDTSTTLVGTPKLKENKKKVTETWQIIKSST
jgi:hypothetical protein